MSIVLSLQGCVASGKTTALSYIEKNVPYVNVSYEFKRFLERYVEQKIKRINSYVIKYLNIDITQNTM